ncbi:MAG TPA: nicotinate-nicotinamide nucleotide adenylyltransferase [Thermotogota bacterium]|nr:nicotinate-nicotinamide nucleotide adenylyltransferase [Thermotogota bacterium]HRW91837.1 nicotinate-nicotinamide nucleotide adenylyltransferase [Thermotogota bacterium]
MTEKTGFFGGTFNPLHVGHLLAAMFIRERAGLEKVCIVPAGISPFKQGDPWMAPFEKRLHWAKQAFLGMDGFEVLDLERPVAGKPSFTAETMRTFFRQRGFFPTLILGMDAFSEFHRWREAGFLRRNCPLLVFSRKGLSPSKAPEHSLPEHSFVEIPRMDISSSLVRGRIQEKKPIRGMVAESMSADVEETYRAMFNREPDTASHRSGFGEK